MLKPAISLMFTAISALNQPVETGFLRPSGHISEFSAEDRWNQCCQLGAGTCETPSGALDGFLMGELITENMSWMIWGTVPVFLETPYTFIYIYILYIYIHILDR